MFILQELRLVSVGHGVITPTITPVRLVLFTPITCSIIVGLATAYLHDKFLTTVSF